MDVDMGKPTDRAAPEAAPQHPLNGLIAEAAGATEILPPYERCEELNRDLRAAIGDLYLAAQQELPNHSERSRDWYRIQQIIEDTDAVLAGDLGSGLLSAAMQLGALGRQARALATCGPEGES